MDELVAIGLLDVGAGIVQFISFSYSVLAFLGDYSRIFRVVIEDAIIVTIYPTTGEMIDAEAWLGTRWLIKKAFEDSNNQPVHIRTLFNRCYALLGDESLADVRLRDSVGKILAELEKSLLGEFRTLGVRDEHILVTSDMFQSAIGAIAKHL